MMCLRLGRQIVGDKKKENTIRRSSSRDESRMQNQKKNHNKSILKAASQSALVASLYHEKVLGGAELRFVRGSEEWLQAVSQIALRSRWHTACLHHWQQLVEEPCCLAGRSIAKIGAELCTCSHVK